MGDIRQFILSYKKYLFFTVFFFHIVQCNTGINFYILNVKNLMLVYNSMLSDLGLGLVRFRFHSWRDQSL